VSKIKLFKYYHLIFKVLIGVFILIIYINLSIEDYNKNITLYLLFYMSINLVFYITSNKLIKVSCLLLDIALILYLTLNINYMFIILLSQITGELYEIDDKLDKVGTLILVTVGFFMGVEYGAIYYLLLSITYLSSRSISFYYEENKKLLQEIQGHKKILNEYGRIIENSKEFERQAIYTSLLEDRNKLAQEMHDKVGHVIAGSIMQLEAAKLLINSDSEKSKTLLESSISVLRSGVDDIRLTLRGLKPIEEELGINRLKFQVEKSLKETSIKGYVNINGDLGKINYTKWKAIIENTREALTNSLKYSNCRGFWVNINVMNKMIRVELKDDGKGEEKVVKGMGLKGMEQRCEDIGGKLVINGDYGFSVIMLLPV